MGNKSTSSPNYGGGLLNPPTNNVWVPLCSFAWFWWKFSFWILEEEDCSWSIKPIRNTNPSKMEALSTYFLLGSHVGSYVRELINGPDPLRRYTDIWAAYFEKPPVLVSWTGRYGRTIIFLKKKHYRQKIHKTTHHGSNNDQSVTPLRPYLARLDRLI